MEDDDWFKDAEFSAAISIAAFGRKEELIKLLRNDHPLTHYDKIKLADYLEGKLSRKPGRPRVYRRGYHSWLDMLALEVEERKEAWREEHSRKNAPHRKIVAEVAELHGISFHSLDMRVRQSKQRNVTRLSLLPPVIRRKLRKR